MIVDWPTSYQPNVAHLRARLGVSGGRVNKIPRLGRVFVIHWQPALGNSVGLDRFRQLHDEADVVQSPRTKRPRLTLVES